MEALTRPLKVVATAYACEPGGGSENGIGWHIVRELAREHELHVITRENNRPAIEAALVEDPVPMLRFSYFDLPVWARWWKRGTRGLQAYYYLWQWGAARKAEVLHRAHEFDLAHHVTFGRYWMPSFLWKLRLPLVWGPVGGGESSPRLLRRTLGVRGQAVEWLRDAARWLGERDPFVRRTARSACVALATTSETAARLHQLGAGEVRILGNAALPDEEVKHLAAAGEVLPPPVRFLSMGRLLPWKGFHLGLEAFARLEASGLAYWIVGDGPERLRLEQLARTLGVADRVQFHGNVSREEALRLLRSCHVLVHPSFHDSGGWVCVEAMAAGRPVVCLDLGGPALIVADGTGFRVRPDTPDRTVARLALAMQQLTEEPDLLRRMDLAARSRVQHSLTWTALAAGLKAAYRHAMVSTSGPASENGTSLLRDSNPGAHVGL